MAMQFFLAKHFDQVLYGGKVYSYLGQVLFSVRRISHPSLSFISKHSSLSDKKVLIFDVPFLRYMHHHFNHEVKGSS